MATLYLMFGYPGAGKTTAAKIIHQLTGAVHLSSDTTRVKMFAQPTFSKTEHDQLYSTLDQRTEALLAQGKDVIYDANLNRYQHRAEKYAICRRTDARQKLLWVKTPKDLAKQRASHTSRQHLVPTSESPHAMFDRIAGVIEKPHPDEPYIELDGTNITPDYIKHMLSL